MKHELPIGSRIVVSTEGADTLITVPHASAGLKRYFQSLFLLAWLCAWVVGWAFVAILLASGPQRGTVGTYAFLVVWLVAWTVGGVWAMYTLYRLLRPSAETLRLAAHGVMYDSGIPPPTLSTDYASLGDARKSMFPKRTRVELDRRKLQSLRLRETNDGNRLTVDVDAVRVDIGQAAGEIEREWLYQLLVKRYGLTQPDGR